MLDIEEKGLARVDDTGRNITIADPEEAAAALAHLLGTGDLSRLTPSAKVALYLDTCHSLSLNPRTRPLDWIEFFDPETKGKKLALYPNRSCAEQLRRQHQISIRVVKEEIVGDLFKVTVEGRTPTGRTDEATAYVPLTDRDGKRLRGDRLGNAFMKAQTKAKRRLTFSMVGMASPPDPEELRGVRSVIVDGTGRMLDAPTEEDWAVHRDPDMAKMLGVPTYEDATEQSPLAGHADQRPTSAELERPAPKPAVSLYCDANKWRAAYFGATADTVLETAEGRRQFFSEYTAGFPEALRTDSLSVFLKHATDRQADEMVMTVRLRADHLRAGSVSDASDEGEEEEPLDDDAQYQADLLAEVERDRAATQQPAF